MKASSEIDDALQRIEKLDRITKEDIHTEEIRRLHTFLSDQPPQYSDHSPVVPTSSLDAGKDEARLPCIVLPSSRFSFSRSYNRDEVLEGIRSHFGAAVEGFKCIALHGVGGVGKSHIAHKYAYVETKKRTYDAILWIHSDTSLAIEQSFTDLAVRLQLLGANPGNHTENKIRVLTWLQQTSKFC
jgi:NB-ARC domain